MQRASLLPVWRRLWGQTSEPAGELEALRAELLEARTQVDFLRRESQAQSEARAALDQDASELARMLDTLCRPEADLSARLAPASEPMVPVAGALGRLMERLATVHGSLEVQAGKLGVGVARNIQQVVKAATEQESETRTTVAEIENMTQAARSAADATQEVAAAGSQTAAAAQRGRQAMSRVAERIEGAREAIEACAGAAGALVERSREIDRVTGTIAHFAANTQLLALNAAIEAARAGQHGRGFAVVADEVRKLANETADATRMAARVVQDLQSGIDQVRRAVTAAVGQAAGAVEESHTGDQTFAEIAVLMEKSADQVSGVASANEELLAIASDLEGQVTRLGQRAAATRQSSEEAFASADMAGASEEVYRLLASFRSGTRVEYFRDITRQAAREAEGILEEMLASGRLTLDQLLDLHYTEVRGPLIQRLSRLFDVSRVPPEGFDPPKFLTAWDEAVDRHFTAISDKYLKADDRVVLVTMPDLNGYLCAHASKHTLAWTGNYERDLVGNRVKRFSDNRTELAAARVGIPGSDKVPRRASRQQWAAAGVDPDALTEPNAFILQTYARNTGEIVHNLAVPVFVRGRRWGAMRIGYA